MVDDEVLLGERSQRCQMSIRTLDIEQCVAIPIGNIEISHRYTIKQTYGDVSYLDFGVEFLACPLGSTVYCKVLHRRNC